MDKLLYLQLNNNPFPSADEQIEIATFKYSAKRMGNAPIISATIDFPRCLDSKWTEGVYVEFRGEKFFLKDIPSSSYSNTSCLYKHTAEFVSERTILETVYFFDVVKTDTTDDKPVSNNSTFSFSGNLNQFAQRLQRSMYWSGIDYTVVVDSDVPLEDKFNEFNDQFIFDALKSMYDTYGIPFYFKGKEIHIGYADNLVTTPLEYGVDNSLISIKRNRENSSIINRVTARGSERNITYYYPNPTPKGYVSVEAKTSGATIEIEDQVTFANMVPLGANVSYVVGKDLTPDKYITLYNDGSLGKETIYDSEGVYFGPYRHGNRFFIPFIQKESGSVSLSVSYNVTNGSSDHVNKASCVKNAKLTSLTESIAYHPVITDNWNVSYNAEVPSGVYYLVLDVWLYTATGLSVNATITAHDNKYNYWKIDGDNREYSPAQLGVSIIGKPTSGDSFSLKVDKRVNVQNRLMPSIYRETDGRERFYNAENGEYQDENGDDIVFSNPYSESRAREFIYEDDEIYPSITGMKNSAGLPIDVIEEFAFDDKDNDDIYPEGDPNAGKYKHPYFFAKLRKFDGEHGFNLFDHAIEGQPMTISMTSGKCAACNFTIGVDEEYDYNTVQVDSNGNLMRDEDGNVLCGRKPQPQADKIDRQNDTQNNSVWIALKKEEQTFGIIMPNVTNNYRPEAGDTFVILNIDLPDAYVFAAEERLKHAAIKHMAENNDYKFNYSVELSRIFFEENPDFASEISENSKAIVRYNDKEEEMFVSSYSYDMSNSSPLPKVTIELNNDIKIVKNAIDKATGIIGATVSKLGNRFQLSFDNTDKKIDNISHKGDDIKSQLTGVEASVDKVSKDVSDIQDDREAYEIESSFIESEYDPINKEFDLFVAQWGEYIDADGLAYKDKNGVIYLCRASNSIFEQFNHSHSKYLNELNKVINSKGKVVFTPAYSIAKSDYYIARAAMSKAISTQTRKEISDLDYLKDAFGADSVMDSNGVVLSQLVSVKDADGDVVAGIYGGANETLNNGGFKDDTHGALMQFAGASSAQDVANAKYRVYEDGTLFANSGVFGGLVKRAMTTLTAENIGDYTEIMTSVTGSTITRYSFLDMVRAGSFVVFDDNINWVRQWNKFELPYYKPRTVMPSQPDAWRDLEYMLSLVGSKVVIYFRSGTFQDCCFTMRTVVREGVTPPYWGESCGLCELGGVIIATCVDEKLDGELVITWEYKTYKTI